MNTLEPMNTLGQRIAHYRKSSALTQEELAEKCGVTAQAVSKWENDVNAPDISLLPLLAATFGISCDELLGVGGAPRILPRELSDPSRRVLKLTVLSNDGDRVTINLPLAAAEAFLASPGLNTGDALDKVDIPKIIGLAASGAAGKLVEVTSSEGDVVEITVE